MRKILVTLALVVGACSLISGDLTRARAKRLIEESTAFRETPSLPLAQPDKSVEAGIREGLWAIVRRGIQAQLELTPEGRKHFSRVDAVILFVVTGFVVPQGEVRRVVAEVTGIAEASSGEPTRSVEFTWRYEGLNDVAQRYTGENPGAPHTGKALCRLYDDGWRVERVDMQPLENPVFRPDPAAERRHAQTATPPGGVGVDLDGYCRRHGYSGVYNNDGTGFGWRCSPGDAGVNVDLACKEQWGRRYSARLKSTPPGGPDDWVCVI